MPLVTRAIRNLIEIKLRHIVSRDNFTLLYRAYQ